MNSRYYVDGTLTIDLTSYRKVFDQVKRELDLNEDDTRYDTDIAYSISDNAIRIAKQELWPNQRLKTVFRVDNSINRLGFFGIDLSAIADVLSVKLLDHSNNSVKCLKEHRDSCCSDNSTEVTYERSGNYLQFNNIVSLDSNKSYSIELLTNGGNLLYWFGIGYRLLVQAVKADMYLNFFKSPDEYNSAQSSYMLLYNDLEKQTYNLYKNKIEYTRVM